MSYFWQTVTFLVFLITLLVGFPIGLFLFVKKLNSISLVKLNKSFSLKEVSFRLISHPWTLKEILIFSLLGGLLFLYKGIFGFPTSRIIIVGGIIFAGWYVVSKTGPQDENASELASVLSKMLSRVNESAIYVDALAKTIEEREKEAADKKAILEDLENRVKDNKDQAQALAELSDRQKELLLELAKETTKDALKPNPLNALTSIILALALNLIATIIWTLADNPGKDQILNVFDQISKIVSLS